MRANVVYTLIITVILTSFLGCRKTKDNPDPDQIIFKALNKEYVFIRNVDSLQASNDEISNHIDSILSGLINVEFVSTGQQEFDLSGDGIADIGFEIINLHDFNPNGLPASFDSLAARAYPKNIEILDNSTWGYCDALTEGNDISELSKWTSTTCVLGTFMNAGQFQGQGNRYLGYRIAQSATYVYGWVKVYCSQHSDTLRIIEYGYNANVGSKILAGQKQ